MRKTVVSLCIAVILSFGTVLPFFNSGFFDVHDNTQLARVYEMGVMLSSGEFPVRWVPDLGYGYGYPIFNFYSPLPYYIGGIFTILGFDVLIATKAMFVVGILLAPITMFFLGRKFFGDTIGVITAVIYAYFPYHAVNIYVRGAVGELFAYAFLPLIFLGFFSLIYANKREGFLYPALYICLGVFLVATSHNLTFLMLMIEMAIVGVAAFIVAKKGNAAIPLIVAVLAGIALASFYILPAFFEMRYTDVSSQVGGGADFRDHFVCIGQFWDSMWGYGGSVNGCIDGMSYKLGKLNIILIAASVMLLGASLIRRRGFGKIEKIAVVGIVGFILSVFMSTSVSLPAWEYTPFVEYLQYPWRFLNFIAIFSIIVIAYLLVWLNKRTGKIIFHLTSALIIAVTIILNAKLFVPQDLKGVNLGQELSSQNLRYKISKISDEYLPSGFQKPRQQSDLFEEDVTLLKTKGFVSFNSPKPNHYFIKYSAVNDGVIHVNRAYFPFWTAELNGENLPIVPTSDGMNLSVPKGEGIIKLSMGNTPLQLAGNLITILSFLVIATAIIVLSRRQKS